MKLSKIITAAVWTGIAGVILSFLLLLMYDHPETYRTYLIASAIVFGFSILAAAVAHKNDT